MPYLDPLILQFETNQNDALAFVPAVIPLPGVPAVDDQLILSQALKLVPARAPCSRSLLFVLVVMSGRFAVWSPRAWS